MRIYIFILCVFLLVFLFSCDKKTNPTTPEIQEDTVIPETTKPIAADDWQANLITTSEDGFIFYLNADFSKKNQFSPGDIIVSDYGEGFLRKIISVNTTSEVVALITENAALVEAVTNGSVSFVEPLVLEKEAHLQKEGGSYYNILRKNGPDNITGIEYSFQEILFDSDGDYLTTLDQVIVSGVYEITPIIYGDLEISQGQLKRFSLNYAVNEKLQITGKVNVPVPQSTSVALEPVLFAPIVVYLDTVPVKLTPELTFIVGADLSVDAAMQSSLNQDLTYALGLVYEEKIWKMESNLQKTFAYEPPTVSRSLHGTFYLKPAFQIKVWDTVSPRLDAELYSELIANPQNNPGVELFAGYDFGIDIGMSIFDYAVLDYQAAVFTDKIQLWHLDALPNIAPTASFTISPTSGTTATTFQFDASGSTDNEDSSSELQVRWDWENDGNWDTDYSTDKIASHQYGSDGTKTILLEVRDSGGLTNTTNKQVAVSSANTVPTASFTISPTSGTTETTFQFDATSSSDNEDDSSVLQVRWDWENDGAWDTDYSTSKTASHQYGSEGTKTVRLEVRDNGGLTKTATKQVTVSLDNTAPTASFTVSPTSGTTETTFQFDASGSSDSEDDISALQVRWDWENDGSWDTDYSTSKTASLQYGSEGTRTILLEVKDSGGLTNTTTKQVTVSSANTAPVASFIISPTSGTTETTFQFDASGSSDNEDATSALQVRWDWENDGTWDTNFSTGKITSHQYSSEGTKTILLEVKDSGGLTNTTTRQVVVSPANTEPTASFTIFPLSGTTESNFQFDASGSSDNEDATSVLQVRWDWENDGNWDTDYSTTKTALHMFSSAGTKTVLLEVRDSGGLTNNTTKQVEVITASPGETGTVTDIDGNVYKTVKIGNQWWMAENLKVTRFNNGDSIPIVSDDVAWTNTGIAYCIYDNDTRNIDNYGFLYKFWALNHNNRTIAPQGWHIPTNNDWQTLVDYLGGEAIAGSSMKEEGTVHWAEPNEGATNSSGFTALPGGYRKYTGAFGSINTRAYFWSSEMRDIYTALYQTLHTINASILLGNTIDPGYGFSVRCVKD